MNNLKKLNYSQIKTTYLTACKNNDIDTIKEVLQYMIKHKKEDLFSRLNTGLIVACMNGHLEQVRYFLTSKELSMHANIGVGASFEEPIVKACEYGRLEIIKYLLFSTELSIHADIQKGNFHAFIAACRKNQIEVIDYLFNETNIKDKITIDTIKRGFDIACRNLEVEPIKFLLENTNLKNEIDFNTFISEKFEVALLSKNLEAIRYFIFDLNIEKSIIIEQALKRYPNQEIENWFELKSINRELTNSLIDNKDYKNKKIKI